MLSTLAGLGAADHAVVLAEALRDRGHRVTVVSSDAGLEAYRRLGFEVHPVPEPPIPARPKALPPLARRAWQLYTHVQRNVIDPVPAQWAVVERVLQDAQIDVIVTDGLFVGAAMLAAKPAVSRPAVIMLGFAAPWIPDPLVPPYGMGFAPSDDPANRLRTTTFELVAARAMLRLSRSFNAQVHRTFGVEVHGDIRASPAFGDVWAQLTVPRFEYPRIALPGNFRFVGPLHPREDRALPDWWDPAAEPPVIAIRAGSPATVEELVLPLLQAFGGTDTSIVVAGSSRAAVAAAAGRPLPANAHFEEHLPWSRFTAQRTVVVSDGDYLHTQHALRQGIPVVVAGTLETDVETGARVAWAGAGIDLRAGRPTPAALRDAITRLREEPSFRTAAARIAVQIATTDAEDSICGIVEAAAAERAA